MKLFYEVLVYMFLPPQKSIVAMSRLFVEILMIDLNIFVGLARQSK